MPVTDDINDVPLARDIDDLMHVYDRLRRNAFDPSKSMIDTMASLLKQSAALLRIHVPQSHKLRSLFSAREIEAREREEAESRLAANWCKAGPVADAATYEVPDDDDTFGPDVIGSLDGRTGYQDAKEAFWSVVNSDTPITCERSDGTTYELSREDSQGFRDKIKSTITPSAYTSRPDVVGPAFERAIAAEWEVGR